MTRIPTLATLTILALALAACSTNTKWRRANRDAQWTLTKLRTLKPADRLNRDREVAQADLERERLDIEAQIRVCQKDGDHAAREGDEAGLDEIIAQLDALQKRYEALAEKY